MSDLSPLCAAKRTFAKRLWFYGFKLLNSVDERGPRRNVRDGRGLSWVDPDQGRCFARRVRQGVWKPDRRALDFVQPTLLQKDRLDSFEVFHQPRSGDLEAAGCVPLYFSSD